MLKLCTILPIILLALGSTGCLAEPQAVFEFNGSIKYDGVFSKNRIRESRPIVCDFKTRESCILEFTIFQLHITHDVEQESFALIIRNHEKRYPYHSDILVEDMKKGVSLSQTEWTKACNCLEFSDIEALTLNIRVREATL